MLGYVGMLKRYEVVRTVLDTVAKFPCTLWWDWTG